MQVARQQLSEGWQVWIDEQAGIVLVDPSVPDAMLDQIEVEIEAGLARRWDAAPHADRSRPPLVALPGGRADSRYDDAVG